MERLEEISLAGLTADDLAGKRAVGRRINAALESIGFFVVSDHGVAPELIDAAVATASAFFALPTAEKARIRSTVIGSPRGFIAFGAETLALTTGAKAPPDLKEGFGMGP